jgi:hypothetical protein
MMVSEHHRGERDVPVSTSLDLDLSSLDALKAIINHVFGGLIRDNDKLQEIVELASVADRPDHEALVDELTNTWKRLRRGLDSLAGFLRAANVLIDMAQTGDGEHFPDPERARDVANLVLETLMNPDKHSPPNKRQRNNNRKNNKPRPALTERPGNAKRSNGETG